MNFWDNSHPLSADNERLYEALVPGSGNCDTLQGELIRASSRIGYDWYNNGWGCNNWSGAVVFLQDNVQQLAGKRIDDERKAFFKALNEVHQYSHGERVDISDERADVLVTTIQAYVVQNILDNPEPIVNTLDMLDFGEPDVQWQDDDHDDYWDDRDDDDDDDC